MRAFLSSAFKRFLSFFVWVAEGARPAPGTTVYPCQALWDLAPKTAYARGVMTTGPLKRRLWQNGGAITRSLHGRFAQLASAR